MTGGFIPSPEVRMAPPSTPPKMFGICCRRGVETFSGG
jgi:hypothetical protein